MLSLICFFPLFFSTLLICRFHNITHIPTAFSDNLAKLLYFLAKPYKIWQNHTFWQKSGVSPNCVRNFPIVTFTAVSQNARSPIVSLSRYSPDECASTLARLIIRAKKRSPPATPVNPSMLEIPSWKPCFQLFQAISLYFSQIVLKFLWHQLLIAACAATLLWWLLPRGKNVYPPFTPLRQIYPT